TQPLFDEAKKLGVARQVDLTVLAHDRGIGADQDRGIEAPPLGRQLRVADVETNAQFFRLVEQRLGFAGWHALLEERGVDFGLILHPPSRKESGEGKLWEYDEFRTHAVRFCQQILQSGNSSSTRVRLVERSELGGGDPEVSGHGVIR